MGRVTRLLTPALLCLALVAAGCGGDDDGESANTTRSEAPAPARAADFPSAEGKTLDSLRGKLPKGGEMSPSTVYSLKVGDNRLGFALFTTDRKFIPDAQVAVYTFKSDGSDAQGPYPARFEAFDIKPEYQSRTTQADLENAKGVYVADVPVERRGKRIITALAKIDGKMTQTSGFELPIGTAEVPDTPEVGEQPPEVHTQTISDAAGNAESLTTRVPPAEELLKDDFAEVVGSKPVVITLSTPLLCQSRVCGPVVDVVEQVRAETQGDVSFIQQEIYNDNQVDKGFREEFAAWKLPSEPWTFVIGENGRISTVLEGAFSTGELQRAVDKVTQSS
jgi:hypothetical protein